MREGLEEFEPFHYPQSGDEYKTYSEKQRYENLAVYRMLKHSAYHRGVTNAFGLHVVQLVPKYTAHEPMSSANPELYPLYFHTEKGEWFWNTMVNDVIRKGSVYCYMRAYRDLWDAELRKIYYKIINDDPVLEFTYEMAGLSPRHFQAW